MIAEIVGCEPSTISRWLHQIQHESLEGRHDNKSLGRPCTLGLEQESATGRDLDVTPHESGFGCGSQNFKMIAKRILERFGIICGRRTTLKLANRLRF